MGEKCDGSTLQDKLQTITIGLTQVEEHPHQQIYTVDTYEKQPPF